MDQIRLNQLIEIFNSLTKVKTCGEDTVIMGQALSQLRIVLTEIQQHLNIYEMQEERKQQQDKEEE